jgi:hypothetical protein
MSKLICWILLVVCTFHGYAKRERVHVDFDKYACKADDSIYFKGKSLRVSTHLQCPANFTSSYIRRMQY